MIFINFHYAAEFPGVFPIWKIVFQYIGMYGHAVHLQLDAATSKGSPLLAGYDAAEPARKISPSSKTDILQANHM